MNGNPRILAAIALMLMASGAARAGENDDPLGEDIGVVLTPTRLKQSVADVPGSVTVLTADMLDRYGVRSIPEAMRLVPGMEVAQLSNGDYRIMYHGTNLYSQRRINVLVDGQSVFRSDFAFTDWNNLPVSIDDVQRIEVVRGSGTASYGSNALLAIVNIITRDTHTTQGASARLTAGSRNTREAYAQYGGRLGGSTSFRVSAQHSETKGFDKVDGFGLDSGSPDHDASKTDRFSWKSSTDLGPDDQVELRFTSLNGKQDQVTNDQYQVTYPDVRTKETNLSLTWRHTISESQELKVQAYQLERKNTEHFNECLPAFAFLPELGDLWKSNPDYVRAISAGVVPSGGSAQDNALLFEALLAIKLRGASAFATTCGAANNDFRELTRDIELQHTLVASKALRVVSGVGLRRDTADSQTYFGGSVGNSTWRAFANVEYRPIEMVNLNAGGFYQKDSITGSSFSPRASVNVHLDANNTVRAVVSRSDRMPDIHEQLVNWSYLVTNMTPPVTSSGSAYFAQSARGPGNLEPERMFSREIGYTGNFPRYGLVLDAKIFDDKLSDLISERLNLDSFNPTNNGRVHLSGAELQVQYESGSGWSAHGGYTRLNNSSDSLIEQTLYSRDSALLGVSRAFDSGWRAGLAVYWAAASPRGQTRYGRQDLTVSKSFKLPAHMTMTPSFTVSHLSDRLTSTLFDLDRVSSNGYADTTHFSATLRVTY